MQCTHRSACNEKSAPDSQKRFFNIVRLLIARILNLSFPHCCELELAPYFA